MNRHALAALALATCSLCTTSCPRFAHAQRVPPGEAIPFEGAALQGVEPNMPAGLVAASAMVGGLNLTTSFLNLTPRAAEETPTWSRYAGVLGGLAGIGLGGALLVQDKYEDRTGLGVSNIAVGTLSTIAGVASFIHAKKASETASKPFDPNHVTIAAAFHGGMAPGLGLRLRF